MVDNNKTGKTVHVSTRNGGNTHGEGGAARFHSSPYVVSDFAFRSSPNSTRADCQFMVV